MAHVLVVDDERIVAQSLQIQLQRLGHTVLAIASTGEEAVDFALRLRPDIVLMDIMLRGEIDGVEAARRIHARMHIPVIFATACSDPETFARANATEPTGYLVKPFGKDELQHALRHALDREIPFPLP
jgi:CheY-like chemotaxis protein